MSRVHSVASGSQDLERRLKGLGKGIGDVTASIFLRELRGVWEKADPYPTRLELLAGERLGILQKGLTAENALEQLKVFWVKNGVREKSFIDFETALLRLGKECRKGRCSVSPRLTVGGVAVEAAYVEIRGPTSECLTCD